MRNPFRQRARPTHKYRTLYYVCWEQKHVIGNRADTLIALPYERLDEWLNKNLSPGQRVVGLVSHEVTNAGPVYQWFGRQYIILVEEK